VKKYKWPTNTWNNIQHLSLPRKCKSKLHWESVSTIIHQISQPHSRFSNFFRLFQNFLLDIQIKFIYNDCLLYLLRIFYSSSLSPLLFLFFEIFIFIWIKFSIVWILLTLFLWCYLIFSLSSISWKLVTKFRRVGAWPLEASSLVCSKTNAEITYLPSRST
jgi:hypothetical protein